MEKRGTILIFNKFRIKCSNIEYSKDFINEILNTQHITLKCLCCKAINKSNIIQSKLIW